MRSPRVVWADLAGTAALVLPPEIGRARSHVLRVVARDLTIAAWRSRLNSPVRTRGSRGGRTGPRRLSAPFRVDHCAVAVPDDWARSPCPGAAWRTGIDGDAPSGAELMSALLDPPRRHRPLRADGRRAVYPAYPALVSRSLLAVPGRSAIDAALGASLSRTMLMPPRYCCPLPGWNGAMRPTRPPGQTSWHCAGARGRRNGVYRGTASCGRFVSRASCRPVVHL